jgi:hypothetical protein
MADKSKRFAICATCGRRGPVEGHHIKYQCEYGPECPVIDMCNRCHVALHSTRQDFAAWGRLGGIKTQSTRPNWMVNLKQYQHKEAR